MLKKKVKSVVNDVSDTKVNNDLNNKTIKPPNKNDILSKLKKRVGKLAIDIDNVGLIDGYDTDGDGLIDEYLPQSSRRAQYVKLTKPFYARPDFNWDNLDSWIYNQNAVNYYLTYIKKSKYPTDFYNKRY